MHENVTREEMNAHFESTNRQMGELSASVKSLVDISNKRSIENAQLMSHVKTNQERHDKLIDSMISKIEVLNEHKTTTKVYWSIFGTALVLIIGYLLKQAS